MSDEKTGGFKKFFGSDKTKKLIVILGLAGIVLIFCSSIFGSNTKKADNDSKTVSCSEFDTDAYRTELESRLADIISHIDGAGSTGVMITLEGSREYIYAQDVTETNEEKSSDKSESVKNEYVLKKFDDGCESPIIVKENEPKIRGVIVVCAGGGNDNVRNKIIEAVTSVFNITPSRVSVNKISN